MDNDNNDNGIDLNKYVSLEASLRFLDWPDVPGLNPEDESFSELADIFVQGVRSLIEVFGPNSSQLNRNAILKDWLNFLSDFRNRKTDVQGLSLSRPFAEQNWRKPSVSSYILPDTARTGRGSTRVRKSALAESAADAENLRLKFLSKIFPT
ncbi:MAG: hypothetical protein LBJ64_01570 [Deltaproteobacteria bacterium]|jgi:hypothetical protein|nr:hypothetical protein [Deltaproteobacteria bacterium]